MAFFVVHYRYVDDPELVGRVRPVHRQFTRDLFEEGVMKAGGPVVGGVPSAYLVVTGDSLESITQTLDQDPFHTEGVIAERTITQWNPVTGVFAAEADA